MIYTWEIVLWYFAFGMNWFIAAVRLLVNISLNYSPILPHRNPQFVSGDLSGNVKIWRIVRNHFHVSSHKRCLSLKCITLSILFRIRSYNLRSTDERLEETSFLQLPFVPWRPCYLSTLTTPITSEVTMSTMIQGVSDLRGCGIFHIKKKCFIHERIRKPFPWNVLRSLFLKVLVFFFSHKSFSVHCKNCWKYCMIIIDFVLNDNNLVF